MDHPTNGTVLWNEIRRGKLLGKGMMGSVYSTLDKQGRNYAYKIERILPKDVPESFKSSYWRENDFATNLANKHPDHFMVLYGTKIDSSCEHRQDFSGFDFKLEDLPKSQQNYYKRVNASPYCSIQLWSIVDGIIEDLVKHKLKLSRKVFYDLFIQILYIVYLMDDAGYFHNDFHMGNIGYTKTHQKNVNILGHQIPTHGYLLKAIDYGLVLHDKFTMTKGYRHKYENENDLFTVFNMFSLEWKTENIGGKEWKWEHEWMRPVKISKTEKQSLEKYLPDGKPLNKDNYDFLIHKIFKLLEWHKWQRRVLGDDILPVKPHYLLPIGCILYTVKNIYHPKKVLNFFIAKRK